MASIISLFNRLLPFATPGTPLLQDLVHLVAICLALYFAPQIQNWSHQRLQRTSEALGTVIDSETIDYDTEHTPDEHSQVNGVAAPERLHPRDPAAVEDVDRQDTAVNGHGLVVENDDSEDDDAGAGPDDVANGSAHRNVGAKKARSLARKDQKRAYHEFMRSQGDAQRARDAEGAAEREAALEAEKKRRALIEAELDAKKALAREQKREAEKAEREAEIRRRESAIAIVKSDLVANSLSDLHRVAEQVGGDVDEEWAEKVVNASGLLGKKGDTFTMITSTGWVAKVSESAARHAYQQAIAQDISDEHGHIVESRFSELLASSLSQQTAYVSS